MLQGVYEPFHEPKLAHGSARCQPCPRIPLACLAASILAARAIICFYFIWSPIDHSCSQPHARLAASSRTPCSCSARNARGAHGLCARGWGCAKGGCCARGWFYVGSMLCQGMMQRQGTVLC